MKIKDYIKELLFINQGVIIPELGGFVSEYEPAAFDVNENKFLPPSKKITFNAEYNYQDNLLAEFISKKEKIDIDQATKLIKDFAEDCSFKLNKGDKIDFPEIGVLTKSGKSILFNQYKDANLLTDSFGLQSIKTKPVENKKVIKPSVQKPKQKKSYKKLIILSSVAIIFLALVGLSWYFTNGYTNFDFLALDSETENTDNQLALQNAERTLDSIAKADSIKALINESIDENTDLKDALFYQEPSKKEQKPQYSAFHIVAGSFRKMENAEKFSSELKSKGYNPKIIQSGDTLFRIAIYSYTDETEALKELYKLRQNSDIKSVWILKTI